MAFRQQQPRPQPRPVSIPLPAVAGPSEAAQTPLTTQRKRPLDESEEWILFSPSVAASSARTPTTLTERRSRTTAGLSRFSDLGSLETEGARSDVDDGALAVRAYRQEALDDSFALADDDGDVTCQGTEADEEGEELDSLDDGLHAFHEPSESELAVSHPARHSAAPLLDHSGGAVLPTHDGLGTFPTSSGALMQEQLWHFERFNPRKRPQLHHHHHHPPPQQYRRRRSSVQRKLDAMEQAVDGIDRETEKRRRIESWRMEQSRALLEDVERETRRLRSLSSQTNAAGNTPKRRGSVVGEKRPQQDADLDPFDDAAENETFWQRLTRRVIRDLMGIDDSLLSVIFGEELPAEAVGDLPSSHPLQQRPRDPPFDATAAMMDVDGRELSTGHGPHSWEHRLLERIARELGVLVHQLAEHPGAFSTYLRAQEMPPYAGQAPTSAPAPRPSVHHRLRAPSSAVTPPTTTPASTTALFAPTLHQPPAAPDASLWGIEEEPTRTTPAPASTAQPTLDVDRAYWERELDVKMVFNFLLRRLPSASRRPVPPSASSLATVTPNSTFVGAGATGPHRAALIRQHHPLAAQRPRPPPPPSSSSAVAAVAAGLPLAKSARLRGEGSSCASRSTRRSGSARNFWERERGAGSAVGSATSGIVGMGVWGEV